MATTTEPTRLGNSQVDTASYRFTLVQRSLGTGEDAEQLLWAVAPEQLAELAGGRLYTELVYAARQLHHHTGVEPVVVTDGGAYYGLHLQHHTKHAVLADSMSGRVTVLVLAVHDSGRTDEWHAPLMQGEYTDWQTASEAAAAVAL